MRLHREDDDAAVDAQHMGFQGINSHETPCFLLRDSIAQSVLTATSKCIETYDIV